MKSGGNKIQIPDGFSYFDARKMDEYNQIKSLRPKFNLFEEVKPNEAENNYGTILTRAELNFYDRLKLLNIRFEVIKATWQLANDVRMLGKEWELKTISRKTESIIKYIFWKISDQGKRNVIFDVTYLGRRLEWVFDKIRQHLTTVRRGEYREKDGAPLRNDDLFDAIIIVRGNKLIRYK